MRKQPKILPPWTLPEVEPADAGAIKALNRGDATPDQQKRAFDWLVKKACGIGSMSFHPESDRATSFAEGKRFIGALLIHLITAPIASKRTDTNG